MQVARWQTHVAVQRPPLVPRVKVPGWPHLKAGGFAKNPARGGDQPLKKIISRGCLVAPCP